MPILVHVLLDPLMAYGASFVLERIDHFLHWNDATAADTEPTAGTSSDQSAANQTAHTTGHGVVDSFAFTGVQCTRRKPQRPTNTTTNDATTNSSIRSKYLHTFHVGLFVGRSSLCELSNC